MVHDSLGEHDAPFPLDKAIAVWIISLILGLALGTLISEFLAPDQKSPTVQFVNTDGSNIACLKDGKIVYQGCRP